MLLTEETAVLEKILSQCHCVHHKTLADWSRTKPEYPRWKTDD